MSYDYSLFKAPGPGAMDSWASSPPEPLGTFADVAQQLERLLPALSWRQAGRTHFGQAVMSTGAPVELQIAPDDDGLCRLLTVRHITRNEVETLCGALDLVAVDGQKMEVIRARQG